MSLGWNWPTASDFGIAQEKLQPNLCDLCDLYHTKTFKDWRCDCNCHHQQNNSLNTKQIELDYESLEDTEPYGI